MRVHDPLTVTRSCETGSETSTRSDGSRDETGSSTTVSRAWSFRTNRNNATAMQSAIALSAAFEESRRARIDMGLRFYECATSPAGGGGAAGGGWVDERAPPAVRPRRSDLSL